jgi:hypothetical protein
VWLLDIDGVVNTMSSPKDWPDTKTEGARGVGVSYQMTWSPTLVSEILRICQTYDIELRLASTWCSDPVDVLRVLGFGPIPMAFELTGHYARAAKNRAAEQVVADDTALIWTDDEAIEPSFRRWADEFHDSNYLLIEPDDRYGLTPNHIAEIEAWAMALSEERG